MRSGPPPSSRPFSGRSTVCGTGDNADRSIRATGVRALGIAAGILAVAGSPALRLRHSRAGRSAVALPQDPGRRGDLHCLRKLDGAHLFPFLAIDWGRSKGECRMKILACFVGLFLCATILVGYVSLSSSCPVADDLEHGIVFTDPARVGELFRRYRRLDGPFLGVNYVNGIFSDGTTVSYSGLFTYKHWRNGELVQYEAGTEHRFESARVNPSNPSRRWQISATYFVEDAEDFQLGDCIYPAVRIRREGTLTRQDGEVRSDRENYIFIPELMLRVSGTGISYGDVSEVRSRTILDARTWPFTSDAVDVLAE